MRSEERNAGSGLSDLVTLHIPSQILVRGHGASLDCGDQEQRMGNVALTVC